MKESARIMRNFSLSISLFLGASAQAGVLSLGVGLGLDSKYTSDQIELRGDKTLYSFSYEESICEDFAVESSLFLGRVADTDDKGIRLLPKFYYGDLFAAAGLAYHKIDQDKAFGGILGIGFLTSRDSGKIGYGIDITREIGFSKSRLSELNAQFKIVYGI